MFPQCVEELKRGGGEAGSKSTRKKRYLRPGNERHAGREEQVVTVIIMSVFMDEAKRVPPSTDCSWVCLQPALLAQDGAGKLHNPSKLSVSHSSVSCFAA